MLFPDLSKLPEIEKRVRAELDKLTEEQLEERLMSSLRLASKAPRPNVDILKELGGDTEE